jgi:hypothetical protein
MVVNHDANQMAPGVHRYKTGELQNQNTLHQLWIATGTRWNAKCLKTQKKGLSDGKKARSRFVGSLWVPIGPPIAARRHSFGGGFTGCAAPSAKFAASTGTVGWQQNNTQYRYRSSVYA